MDEETGNGTDASDDELFRAEMEGVTPLPADGRAMARQSGDQKPTAAQLARRAAAENENADPNPLTLGEVKVVHPFDQISWKQAGVQEGVYRKLRLGKYPIDASLDLHHHTVRQARDALWQFVEDATRQGLRAVIVAHGRGDRSETPGRLKSYVNRWLEDLDAVLAYHSAQRHHGGHGATYVLLRKNDDRRNDNRERHARRSR